MIYALDDTQLFSIWTAIRYLGNIREITDEEGRFEVLLRAQVLLTAFVLGLTPLPRDQSTAANVGAGLGAIPKLDA